MVAPFTAALRLVAETVALSVCWLRGGAVLSKLGRNSAAQARSKTVGHALGVFFGEAVLLGEAVTPVVMRMAGLDGEAPVFNGLGLICVSRVKEGRVGGSAAPGCAFYAPAEA